MLIKVYGRVDSSNAAKVFWVLDEMQLAYQRIDCGRRFGGNDTAEYLRMNPHGKVPTLDDNGTIVWESNAVLRYLASQYRTFALWPERADHRATIDQWMDWSATALVPSIGKVRNALKISDVEALAAMPAAIAHFSTLDQWLSDKDYIAGQAFSLADIAAGPAIYRWFLLTIDKPELVNLRNYLERLHTRPAFKTNIADHIA